MDILFAANETAWGGFLGLIRSAVPEHRFHATGGFRADSLAGYDVLIPTMTGITRELLETADGLKLVQQCGAGLEGVDMEAARDLGIDVANVPTDSSGNADSVAEIGVYLIIGLARNARGMAGSLSARKMGQPRGMALTGRTVGIVGLGGIGRAMIRRLRPFGVRLIGLKQSDPETAGRELGLDWAGGPDQLEELLGRSDFVVLSLPMNESTRGLMNRRTFSRMKPGAFLINLSRGGLVEREALEESLSTGYLAGAGLDVFWEEPPDPDDPVFLQNVLATPHVAGSTDLSMNGIVAAVAENLRRIEAGEEPLNVRNR
ncbi:MAG: 2-hydroxyacid dehydrogenase [Deltaproteobacteria bacterium]|nr:2-hydroxyacid dehydrogenase [Deltaproteobacteria bacterium]